MNDIKIRSLAVRFRRAVETVRDNHLFAGDCFDEFPQNCCGDASYLLAEYYRSYGQESIYVCGEDKFFKPMRGW